MGLKELIETSRKYGGDDSFVLAGGGNTSYKNETTLYIKASGTTLADITADGMVRMNRARLDAIWQQQYSSDPGERERQALADLMAAREAGETKRPSVETLLHELLQQQYVVHLHPALVNGLTCSANGKAVAAELYPEGMLWIPVVNPGYVLASHIRSAIESHLAAGKEYPYILFLENHGVFVASDSLEEIDRVYSDLRDRLSTRLARKPDVSAEPVPGDSLLSRYAGLLAEVYEHLGIAPTLETKTILNPEVRRIVSSEEAFEVLKDFGYTPDHLVYCKAAPLWIPQGIEDDEREDFVEERVTRFLEEHLVAPRVVAVEGAGVIAIADTHPVVENAAALFLDLVKLVAFAESFGGPQRMPKDKIDFILNWEVESYRAKVGGSEG